MYTVIENADKTIVKETYKLQADVAGTNICEPVESVRISDTLDLEPIVLLEHDQKQMTAKEMNELIKDGALCFDTPEEYTAWKDKNGVVEYDKDGKPINPKAPK